MKSKFKLLALTLVSLLMLTMAGCGCNSAKDDTAQKPPTNEEYYNYLNERYNHYFKDSKLNNDYDIFAEDFTYDGTYEEFIGAYNNSYNDLKTNLEAFKNDLENNVVKGNAEVDKKNQEVITSIDKNITEVDKYTSGFATETKDYATLGKDEVIKGLRAIGRAPHEAKLELDKLVDDAKNSLGIK